MRRLLLWNKKTDREREVLKKLKAVGTFITVEYSEVSYRLGEPVLRIVVYVANDDGIFPVKSYPYDEELLEQLSKHYPYIRLKEKLPFEELPPSRIILGRLELTRLGFGEE